MKSLMGLVLAVLLVLAQRGSCRSVTNDPKSLQGLRQISSVSATSMTSGSGTRLPITDHFSKDIEEQIKAKLSASHIAVVDRPRMTPDAGRLSISVILMSYEPNRYSFTASCHLDQQMTLVRTGSSGYANTYEAQACGAIPNDAQYLHKVVIDLANGFVHSYTVANRIANGPAGIPVTPAAALQKDYEHYQATYSADAHIPAP